jgi:hypothetical protein
MDSEDVIELSSSPGPPPPPALSSKMRSKRALRRRANETKQACQPTLDKDVLEITDTETEPDDLERDLLLLKVDKGKGKGKENVQDEHITCVSTDTTLSPRGSGRYDAFFVNDDSPVPEMFVEGPLVTLPNQLGSTSRLAPSRTSYEDLISHKVHDFASCKHSLTYEDARESLLFHLPSIPLYMANHLLSISPILHSPVALNKQYLTNKGILCPPSSTQMALLIMRRS